MRIESRTYSDILGIPLPAGRTCFAEENKCPVANYVEFESFALDFLNGKKFNCSPEFLNTLKECLVFCPVAQRGLFCQIKSTQLLLQRSLDLL